MAFSFPLCQAQYVPSGDKANARGLRVPRKIRYWTRTGSDHVGSRSASASAAKPVGAGLVSAAKVGRIAANTTKTVLGSRPLSMRRDAPMLPPRHYNTKEPLRSSVSPRAGARFAQAFRRVRDRQTSVGPT